MKKSVFAIAMVLFVCGCSGSQARLAEKSLAEAEATIRSARLMGAEAAASAEMKKAELLYELAEEDFYKEPQSRLLVYLRQKSALRERALQNAQIAKQHAEKAIAQTQQKGSSSGTTGKSLKDEIDRLKNRNQCIEKEVDQIKAQNILLRQNTEKLKTRMQTLQIEKKQLAGQAAKIRQPVQQALTGDPGDLYRKGFYLYQTRKYDAARKIFQQYLATYDDSLSDNAQYWIGESHMALKQYEQAILAFQTVIKKYPRGNKVPNAILRQALAFYELKDKTSARLLLKKLIKKYPRSNEAKIARSKLKTMK